MDQDDEHELDAFPMQSTVLGIGRYDIEDILYLVYCILFDNNVFQN